MHTCVGIFCISNLVLCFHSCFISVLQLFEWIAQFRSLKEILSCIIMDGLSALLFSICSMCLNLALARYIENNANYTDIENRNWFSEYTKHFCNVFPHKLRLLISSNIISLVSNDLRPRNSVNNSLWGLIYFHFWYLLHVHLFFFFTNADDSFFCN